MDVLSSIWNLRNALELPRIGASDILEILILAFVFYQLLVIVRNTRTWFLIRGLVVLLVFFALAAILRLNTILFIAEHALSVMIIALIVVFQQELRRALEQLGTRSNVLFKLFGAEDVVEKRFDEDVIQDLVTACYYLGKKCTGALIVIEQKIPLEEYAGTGIKLDAVLSSQLLINIFEHNTPLHDGAIVVRGDRVVSATCYLPLSKNMDIPKELGTRHRAAIGVSEVTDSITIVVSEETGKVSVAEGGTLSHNLTPEELQLRLQVLHAPVEEKKFGLNLLKGMLKNES